MELGCYDYIVYQPGKNDISADMFAAELLSIIIVQASCSSLPSWCNKVHAFYQNKKTILLQGNIESSTEAYILFFRLYISH